MNELFQKENSVARTGKEIFEHKKLFQWNKKTRYLEKKIVLAVQKKLLCPCHPAILNGQVKQKFSILRTKSNKLNS